jgi:hypothetical protein
MQNLELKISKKKIKVKYNGDMVGTFDTRKSEKDSKKLLSIIDFHGNDTVSLEGVRTHINADGAYSEHVLYVPKNTYIDLRKI